MILARDYFRKPENEHQVMARHWAFKLERMSVEQRRLAEKFITEILSEEEGNLHRHSVIINLSQPPLLYTSSSISQTTEQHVMIHISDSQTNENNITEPEADTVAKFINNFYSF